MNKEAEKIVKALNLTKHPEGGYFSEVYRSDETIEKELHERFSGKHSLSCCSLFDGAIPAFSGNLDSTAYDSRYSMVYPFQRYRRSISHSQ